MAGLKVGQVVGGDLVIIRSLALLLPRCRPIPAQRPHTEQSAKGTAGKAGRQQEGTRPSKMQKARQAKQAGKQ